MSLCQQDRIEAKKTCHKIVAKEGFEERLEQKKCGTWSKQRRRQARLK